MSGAPILIVDDSPVSLKLTRLLLTFEGFEVRTSERAEEALRMLETFRPALVLTDIQMPGMDGVEMTRRIKSDRRTSAIKVAALTASTSRLDYERALAAGCETCIVKSEDTVRLAAHVRGLLGENLSLPPAIEGPGPARGLPMPGAPSVRRRFLEEGVRRCGVLLESLDTRLDSLGMGVQLHEWAGDSTRGFPAIVKLARFGEELLAESPLRPLLLRECLSDLYFTFEDLLAQETAPPPDDVLQALRGKRIALVGLPAKRCDAICAALGKVEARPLLFSTASGSESQSIGDCDLIMLQVHAGMNAAPLAELAAGAGKLLLAGELRDLLEVAAALPAAAVEFLTGDWEPEEVLKRLALAGTRSAVAPPKPAAPQEPAPVPRDRVTAPVIVLADDDSIIQTILRSVLTNHGMQCHTASNGLEAMRLIRQIQPHAAVLDIDMPEANGYEVLSAIREDGMSTLVVMLSAHQQEADILRSFRLGADDYLVKPFNPMELCVRLKRLVRQGVHVQ